MLRAPALPFGLEARPLAMDDVEPVAALVADCQEYEDGIRDFLPADLRALWSLPGVDLSTDAVGVYSGDRLVAWANVRGEDADVDVHPAFRGQGIGSGLLRWTWDQAAGRNLDRVSQSISNSCVDGTALLVASGYEPHEAAWSLRMPIDGLQPPTLPEGYAFREFSYERDGRAAFDVIGPAFDEWRDTPGDWESWNSYMVGHGSLAEWASTVVEQAERIVGVVIAFDLGRGNDAWIQQLAVERTHRRRGLGSALLRESFARFAERGWTHGALESDSRTGALSLYEHVGMSVRTSYTQWTRRARPAPR